MWGVRIPGTSGTQNVWVRTVSFIQALVQLASTGAHCMGSVGPEGCPDAVPAIEGHSGGSRGRGTHLWWGKCHGGMQKSGKGTHAGGTVAFLCRIRTAGASAVSKGPLSEPLLSPCRTGTDSVLPVSLPRPCSR